MGKRCLPTLWRQTLTANCIARTAQRIQPEPFRLLIHGTEGIGKSTFSSCAPDPIFVQTEDGLSQIDVPRFPLAESFDAVLENLNALLTKKHQFQTVIIDSVDWLEKLAVQKVLETYKGKASIADIDYGRGYAMLIPLFESIIARLNQLRRERKMNVILIAHTKMDKVEDPSGGSYDQYAPRLDKRINGIVREWSDVIAFATHSITKTEEKKGFGTRTVAQSKKDADGNDRVLFLESTPAIIAKSRYTALPTKMSLDGEAFFAALWHVIHPST
jgi:hypothetical protein